MLKFDSRCPIVVLLVFGSVTIAPPSACAEVADPEAVRVLDPDIAKPQREATAADRIGPDGWVYTDFSRAGVPGGIPDVPATVRAEDFGAVPGDDLDDAAAIQRAVDHVVERGQPGAVTLGEGEFVIDRTVDFRGDGIVIRGAGPEQTVLIARFAGQPLDKMGHRSEAPRKPVLSWSGVSQDEAGRRARSLVIEDAHRGDREVVVEDAKRFRVGDPVTIANRRPSREILDVINPQMRDKLRKAYQRSVDRGYFQAQGGEGFAIIAQISGNRLLLDRPLLHDLPLKQEPFVDNDSNYLRGGGAEGISIVQEDATKTQINGINLFRVIGVWVRDVKIGPIGSWPLEIEKAAHCEVRDSHFDDTFARGGGGVGYFGLSKSHYCLVDHVRVERLRHMSLQMSSSGNVVRRCTLRNADLQFHLHWPSDNLIEQCDIDAGWGSEESRGTYGVGVYSPSFFNEQHLPAGRFNAYYNNTIVSPYQSISLGGGGSSGYVFAYNRFVAEGRPNVILNRMADDHLFFRNVFVAKDIDQEVRRWHLINLTATRDVYRYLGETFEYIPGAVLTISGPAEGNRFIENQFYGVASHQVFVGVHPPSEVSNNLIEPANPDSSPEPITPPVPSLFEWQRQQHP